MAYKCPQAPKRKRKAGGGDKLTFGVKPVGLKGGERVHGCQNPVVKYDTVVEKQESWNSRMVYDKYEVLFKQPGAPDPRIVQYIYASLEDGVLTSYTQRRPGVHPTKGSFFDTQVEAVEFVPELLELVRRLPVRHNDIQPNNILFERGEPGDPTKLNFCLLDFGHHGVGRISHLDDEFKTMVMKIDSINNGQAVLEYDLICAYFLVFGFMFELTFQGARKLAAENFPDINRIFDTYEASMNEVYVEASDPGFYALDDPCDHSNYGSNAFSESLGM